MGTPCIIQFVGKETYTIYSLRNGYDDIVVGIMELVIKELRSLDKVYAGTVSSCADITMFNFIRKICDVYDDKDAPHSYHIAEYSIVDNDFIDSIAVRYIVSLKNSTVTNTKTGKQFSI